MLKTVNLGGKCEFKGVVVTPNMTTAATLGVEPLSLEDLARASLPENRVASAMWSRYLLMRAIGEVLGNCDKIGFVRYFAPAVRELLRLEAKLETVSAMGGRLSRLASVAETFKRLLAEQNLIDASQVFFAAAQSVEERQVSIMGYPRLGLGELVFLDALAADGSTLSLPYAEDALFTENLEAAKFLEARAWKVLKEPGIKTWTLAVPTEALKFSNQQAEVRGILARVKHLLDDGVRADTISLIVRDENLYGPLILSVAREYGIDIAAYYALPLKNTRVGSFFVAFIAMVTNSYGYEETTRFLVHPLSDRLDSDLWASIRKNHPQRLADWGSLGLELPTLPTFTSRLEYISVLETLWDNFELRLPRELVALKSLSAALKSLESSSRLSRESFLAELEDIVFALTVPVKPGRGVTVHTPLAVLGAELEHVFILGLAEGHFPAKLIEDKALDFFERKQLRSKGIMIETAPYAAWREQLSFYSVVTGVRQRLTLAYPEQLENQAAEPSYYFEWLGLSPQPTRTYVISEQEQRIAHLLTLEGIGSNGFVVEQAREQANEFGDYDGVTGSAVDISHGVFSATQLSHLLSCPFKWFAAYVLKADGLAEFEEDALLTGNLYHKTLDLLAKIAKGKSNAQDIMLANLEICFAEAEKAEKTADIPAWPAKRLEFLTHLREAISSPNFISEEAQIKLAEQSFTATWQGFKVRGRIDRLDETADGLIITDYKTSNYITKPDVQLSVYEQAAKELFPEQNVRARYFSIKGAKPLPSKSPDDLEVRLQVAKDALKTGSFPPVASKENCEYCSFELLCRKGPHLKGKTVHADA